MSTESVETMTGKSRQISNDFPGRRGTLVSALVLVSITLLSYLPLWHAGFIWDDDDYVTGNRTLLSVEGLWKIWSEPAATPQYYPLVHTSFWVEHWLWGFDPLGYHVNNVLLHALAAVLLWRVLARLSVPGAWLSAAVFALHPVAVESVAWVTERKNVLSGVFYLAALLSYLRFEGLAREPSELGASAKCWRHYGVALVFFVFALLSKTVVCTLPAVLLLVLWWKRGRLGWAQVWPLVPMFVLGAGMGLLTAWMEKHQVGAKGVDWELSWVQRCLIAGRALWFYAGKLLWPHPLTFIYERWEVDAGVAWQYAFPVAALGAIGLLWFWRERLGRGPLVALLYFCGTLFPALGFIDVFPMRYSFVADHFQYLASIGLIALGVALMCLAAQRWGLTSRSMQAGAVVLLLVLGTLTWRQCHMYRDIETLWNVTLEQNPSCWMAHNNLGNSLQERGLLDEAMGHFQKAIVLRPGFSDAHYNLGNALQKQGRLEEAIVQYHTALELNPRDVTTLNNLGNAFQKQGRLDEAIAEYRKALEARTEDVSALNNLGFAVQQRGQVDEAISYYQKALRIKPDFAVAHYNLGLALQQTGRLDEAIASYQKALQNKPDYADASNNIGLALQNKSQLDEAASYYRKALEINPGYAEARYNLGNALLQQGHLAESATQYQEVLETNPGFALARNNLGLALQQLGRTGEAIAQYQKALEIDPEYVEVQTNLAWLLATAGDGSQRDGAKALELALKADRLTGGKRPVALGALAAAYAELENFPTAIDTVNRAIQLAAAQGNAGLVNLFQRHLKLYQGGQRLRDGL